MTVTVLALALPILTINAVIKPGVTWTLPVTVADANNNPILSPAGWTVRCQIRTASPPSTTLFEWGLTPTAGQGLATFTGSIVTLLLAPTDSAGWAWTSGVWDCLLTDPTGRVACLFDGTVTLNSLITR